MKIVRSIKHSILPVGWFERHLNWTAVMITVGGLILSVLVIFISQGFVIPSVYNVHQVSFEFLIYFALSGTFSAFISILGMVWVIRKKALTHWLLLFFTPVSTFSIVIFILILYLKINLYTGNFHRSDMIGIGFLVFFVITAIWIIGLIIVLKINKKTKKTYLERNLMYVYGITSRKSRHKILLYVCIVLLVVVCCTDYFRMNHGVKKYTYEKWNEEFHFTEFSFKCRNGYYESWGSDIVIFPGREIYLSRTQIVPFRLKDSNIQINISPYVIEEGDPIYPTLIQQCIYFYYQSESVWLRSYHEVTDLTISDTFVNGKKAEYATFRVQSNPSEDEYYRVRMVAFELNGDIWTVRTEERGNSRVNNDFINVIDSLRIEY